MKRLVRRAPLRTIATASALATPVLIWTAGDVFATASAATALVALGAERWAWSSLALSGLRQRHRALVARVERLDDSATDLREQQAVLQSLTETFGDLIVQRDASGEILGANAAFRRAFPDGLPDAMKIPDDERRTVELQTAHGLRSFAWIDIPAPDPRTGRAITRSLARDVTDHAEAMANVEAAREKATARDAARSRFLAAAAHEIRNPLNGLNGMAALLGMSKLDPRQRSQVEAIASATSALAHLIEDLLDDARMEAGQLEMEAEPLDPAHLAEQVAELMATRAHSKGIDVLTRVSPDVARMVTGDEGRLRQILLNLLGNAVKFTETGAVTLTLDHDETGLVFAVQDTGPGMNDEDASRIFEVFQHADETLARRLGGVGLGLTISRQIADLMGATIDVASRVGEGSTFTLRLPVTEAPRDRATDTSLATRTVALVTDRPIIAGVLREAVAARGGELAVFDAGRFNEQEDWTHGPVLVDERVVAALARVPSRGVLMRRETEAPLPAGWDTWLRLPWRARALDAALEGTRPHVGDTPSIAHEPAVPDPETLVPVDASSLRPNILVAEDDPVTQLMVRTWLERSGHRITLVDEGGKAARAFREATEGGSGFSGVVLDLNMPGLDGFAALRGMREVERRRERPRAPIIVVTGDQRPETAAAACEAGATHVMVKPVDMDALVRVLASEREKRTAFAQTAWAPETA